MGNRLACTEGLECPPFAVRAVDAGTEPSSKLPLGSAPGR